MERTRPRRSRAEQTGANRVAVLAAARAVFRERGYNAATLEQIAEAAGFSKGVVYSQFASKADLFLCVLDERIAERAEQNRSAAANAAELDPPRIVRTLHRLMSRSDPAWRLAVTEFRIASARDPELRLRYEVAHRQSVIQLAGVLDEIYDATGIAAPVPTTDLATLLLAIDIGVVIDDATASDPLSDHSIEVLLQRLVFGS